MTERREYGKEMTRRRELSLAWLSKISSYWTRICVQKGYSGFGGFVCSHGVGNSDSCGWTGNLLGWVPSSAQLSRNTRVGRIRICFPRAGLPHRRRKHSFVGWSRGSATAVRTGSPEPQRILFLLGAGAQWVILWFGLSPLRGLLSRHWLRGGYTENLNMRTRFCCVRHLEFFRVRDNRSHADLREK